MPPEITLILFALIGVLSLLGIGLVGLKSVLSYRLRKQELGAGGSASELREAIDQLRVELEATQEELRADTAELHERLDFTERLLARRAPGELANPEANTPL